MKIQPLRLHQFVLALAVVFGPALVSQATILVDDTWPAGVRTVQNLPASSAWFAQTASTLSATPGSLVGSVGTSSSSWLTYFTSLGSPVHLEVGDSITVTMAFTNAGVAGNTARGLRIGLLNFSDGGTRVTTDGSVSSSGLNVRGYSLFAGFSLTNGVAGPLLINVRTNLSDANLLSTSSDYGQLGSASGGNLGDPGFSNNVHYTLVFSVTRNTNSVAIATSFSGGSWGTISNTVADAVSTNFNFDAFTIRPNRASDSASIFGFTEFKVELAASGGAAPSITNQPQNQTVTEGQSAAFTVGASGIPAPRYQWYFNTNSLLSNATNATLTLTNVQLTNAGNYSVVVTNTSGSVTSDVAVLTVIASQLPPSIVTQPQSQTAVAGQTATFSVAASGTAPLSYQWYSNATNVLAGATNSSLPLANVQTNSAGSYFVTITNAFGAATSDVAVLTVIVPPAGIPNFDLVGFASLDGFNAFGYDQRLPGGVTGGAGGLYVQVSTLTNLVNNLQSPATLMVEIMTDIDLSPLANNSGGFPAGYPTGEILVRSNKTIFSKNGSTISRGTLRIGKPSLGPQGNIIIRNLKFRNLWVFDPSGNYDTYGWDYIHLEEGSHHVWVDHCDMDQVYDGMIDLAHGSDFLTASWNVFRDQKKCSLIGHSDSNGSEDTNHLNVTFHHNYYVNVAERMPRMRFGNAHVFNLYCENLGYYNPTNFGPASKGIQSTAGAATLVENVYFYHPHDGTFPTIEANGGPTGTVKVVNSTILNLPGVNVAFREYGPTNFSFNFPFATNRPPYPYAMDAVADVPSLVTNFAGVGKLNPLIASQPQNQAVVAAGQSATFTVTVIGASPLSYQWYFNTNTLLANATNATLTITNVQSTNMGGYSVAITNLFGSVTSAPASLAIGISVRVVGSPVLSNGWFQVDFEGTANLTYTVDRTTNLLGPWELAYTNLTAGADGLFQLIVPDSPPAPARFYRTRYP